MAKKKESTYKEAIGRVEEIMRGLENNQYDIDELVPLLKEANALLDFCNKKLRNVEEEVDKIAKSNTEPSTK